MYVSCTRHLQNVYVYVYMYVYMYVCMYADTIERNS
jgi:hypothetical protein